MVINDGGFKMKDTGAKHYAKIVWDYLRMDQKLEKSDCIIVLGSHDVRVAERGVEIYMQNLAPIILFSGALGRLTKELWDRPEARIFAEIAENMGVPGDRIIIEDKATNTGENVEFAKQALLRNGIRPDRVIAVQKSYMERRTYATFKMVWPEVEVITASPRLDFEEYCCMYPPEGMNCDEVINIMVGDLQRVKLYPQKGFQIYQEIPSEVWEAFERLVELGYTRHLID